MMKLYEAIRLGAMLRPQAFGFLMVKDGGGSCAIGSALEAVGVRFSDRGLNSLSPEPGSHADRFWPWIEHTDAVDPIEGHCYSVWMIIVNLNNEYRWTREAIADWLQPIEEAYLSKSHDAHVGAIKARLDEAERPVEVAR